VEKAVDRLRLYLQQVQGKLRQLKLIEDAQVNHFQLKFIISGREAALGQTSRFRPACRCPARRVAFGGPPAS
jgi:hypothetical protein